MQFSLDETFDSADEIVGRTAEQTSYRRESLPPGSNAHLRVRSHAGTGEDRLESGWSAPVPGMTPAPPPEPALNASFVDTAVRLAEGEMVDLVVHYQVRGIAEPAVLELSIVSVNAASDDYELSSTALQIPAGTDVEGNASVALTAIRDRSLAEDDEILEIRLVPATGTDVEVQLGPALEVTIVEAGVSPCTGTVVLGTPPELNETPARVKDTASVVTLAMEFTSGSEGVAFDWLGPYDGNLERTGGRAGFQIVMVDWTTEGIPGGVQHAMTFAWPTGFSPDVEAGLRFRADNDACPGEPAVICTATSCELHPSFDESAGFSQHAR